VSASELTRWWVATLASLVTMIALTRSAHADDPPVPLRAAHLYWEDPAQTRLSLSVSFRDVVDSQIQAKLVRGLPTNIVLSAVVLRAGTTVVVGSTVQSCRITWHVWDEAFRVETALPGSPTQPSWTTTIEGVLRRCGEARHLYVPTSEHISATAALVVKARILVNPVDEELLKKITRWVNRPTSSGTTGPGDALFGAFTGLFLQRIGEAERILAFATAPLIVERMPLPPTIQRPSATSEHPSEDRSLARRVRSTDTGVPSPPNQASTPRRAHTSQHVVPGALSDRRSYREKREHAWR
jgi:hypothetical protein